VNQALILPLDSAKASLERAGGKGANLARLVRAGFLVPRGFLVATDAYRAYVAGNKLEDRIRARVRGIQPDDPKALDAASAAVRALFEAGTMPPELAERLRAAHAGLGHAPVAVRSSATTEDLPDLSFAGQQDTYLNVIGEEALLRAVVQCWSSLWTARAIGYRARNGIPQEDLALAVVVQEMVPSEAAGVLFTADPLTGKRTEAVIDATLGLGEALVSGQVEPDHYAIDTIHGRILSRRLGAKALSIRGQSGGGTIAVPENAAKHQALPDEAIVALADLGRRVAELFGAPQDIEWAWAGGKLFLLQSRPITSLYPLPEGLPPEPLQVLASFGAIQGMLDPMTPLGRGVFQELASAALGLLSPGSRRPLEVAGERLFLNVTGVLRSRLVRAVRRGRPLAAVEPGIAQALDTLWDDPRLAPARGRLPWRLLRRALRLIVPTFGGVLFTVLWPEAGRRRIQSQLERELARARAKASAAATLAQRVALFENVLRPAFPRVIPKVVPGLLGGLAPLYLLHRMAAGLPSGEHDVLEMTRGLRGNVTTEMDLTLWATARAVERDPKAAERFARTDAATLAADYLAGRLPETAQAAVAAFLQRYGMRGVAEIDLGRPRWREEPTMLLQVLQSYLRIKDPSQAPDVVFARGEASAEAAVERLAEAVRQTRWGRLKTRLVRWAARRVRALAGLRESPKFFVIRLFGLVREALLDSGAELVEVGMLHQSEDIFFLHLAELRELAKGRVPDWRELATERRRAYEREKRRRQVPRLLLSDGQAFYGGVGLADSAQKGVLLGSPVSPGVAEGVVHVVLDPAGVQLAPGEILVCPGTDPAWTPLFLAAGGLVTEVGGLLTHGSVVAREYGIPAVVGVHQATTRLLTGQRVRIDGMRGQITVLEP
jgi:pyruvate,water dikinase